MMPSEAPFTCTICREHFWGDRLGSGDEAPECPECLTRPVTGQEAAVLPASGDTLPKGGDAKRAPCASKGSAVGEAETPRRCRYRKGREMMTEQEARDRAKAAAATVYSDNLLGRIASMTAIEVAQRALLAYAKEREERLWTGPIDESGPAVRKGKSRWT